jgi:hypothetical protein
MIDWAMVIGVWLAFNALVLVGFMAFGGRDQPC